MGALGGDFLRSGVDLGMQYSKAFAAGFVTAGPGGVATVLPMAIVGGLGSPSLGKSFAESGLSSATTWSTNFFSTMSSAFEGGGGFMGGIKSLATQGFGSLFLAEGATAAGGFLGSMQGVFTALGGIPLVGPLLQQFGPALLKGIGKLAGKVWGGIKNLFGGPSEAELLARELFSNFHKGAKAELDGTERYADEVARAVDDGWDVTLAETRAAFILWGTDAGKTYDQAFADYGKYQDAVKSGNTDLMKQIEDEYKAYRNGASATMNQVSADASTMASSVSGQLNALSAKRWRVNIEYKGKRTGDHGEVPGRQHGGPVSAGSPYLIGEAGPEMFVPGQSGSVVSNKSIPTAEEIGAAVAAAMQRVPLVVPQDAVTDAMLRNAPRRQALHGTA